MGGLARHFCEHHWLIITTRRIINYKIAIFCQWILPLYFEINCSNDNKPRRCLILIPFCISNNQSTRFCREFNVGDDCSLTDSWKWERQIPQGRTFDIDARKLYIFDLSISSGFKGYNNATDIIESQNAGPHRRISVTGLSISMELYLFSDLASSTNRSFWEMFASR